MNKPVLILLLLSNGLFSVGAHEEEEDLSRIADEVIRNTARQMKEGAKTAFERGAQSRARGRARTSTRC